MSDTRVLKWRCGAVARRQRMKQMEQPMRVQGVLDGPRADGRLAPSGGVESRKPLIANWTTHGRPRAWTARPSESGSGVRATAERRRACATRDTRRWLGVGGRSWHVAPRARAEGEEGSRQLSALSSGMRRPQSARYDARAQQARVVCLLPRDSKHQRACAA